MVLLMFYLSTENTFAVINGDRIKAASSGAYVRDASLATVLFVQDSGVHGTVTAGPVTGTAGGFSGNWWRIRWDSQPPDQGTTEGWCAETGITPVPLAGDIERPSFASSLHYSSNANLFWRLGFAPSSTNPPNGQLGTALGNCTWYAHGRLRELGYDPTQLDMMSGNAYDWDDQAPTGSVRTTPAVGAIAQSDNGPGHVAVVESVHNDGTITVSESSYVLSASSTWNFLWRHRTVAASSFEHYIYIARGAITEVRAISKVPGTPVVGANGTFGGVPLQASDARGYFTVPAWLCGTAIFRALKGNLLFDQIFSCPAPTTSAGSSAFQVLSSGVLESADSELRIELASTQASQQEPTSTRFVVGDIVQVDARRLSRHGRRRAGMEQRIFPVADPLRFALKLDDMVCGGRA